MFYNRFKEEKMCKNLRLLSFGEFLRCVVEKGNPLAVVAADMRASVTRDDMKDDEV